MRHKFHLTEGQVIMLLIIVLMLASIFLPAKPAPEYREQNTKLLKGYVWGRGGYGLINELYINTHNGEIWFCRAIWQNYISAREGDEMEFEVGDCFR